MMKNFYLKKQTIIYIINEVYTLYVAAKALHLLKPVGMIFHNSSTFGEILYLWRVDPNTWS